MNYLILQWLDCKSDRTIQSGGGQKLTLDIRFM